MHERDTDHDVAAAKRLRRHAGELRSEADGTPDVAQRNAKLSLADDYEQLAETVDSFRALAQKPN